MPNIGELIQAYRDRTGASYRDLAKKVRHELHHNTIQKLVEGQPKSFAEARTMELLAEMLDVPVATVVLGYAASLDIPVRDTAPELARRLPAGAERLTDRDLDAIIGVIRALVLARNEAAHGPAADVVDLARPPVPDLSRVAARRGRSEGRRVRDQHDRDGEGT